MNPGIIKLAVTIEIEVELDDVSDAAEVIEWRTKIMNELMSPDTRSQLSTSSMRFDGRIEQVQAR